MDWTEINIEISADQVDEAAAIAQMVVPYGIYIEDYSDLRTEAPKIAHIDLIDEELLQKDVTKALIHIYISPDDNPAEAIAFLREKYTAAGIANSISTTAVKQEEWATAWKQYSTPRSWAIAWWSARPGRSMKSSPKRSSSPWTRVWLSAPAATTPPGSAWNSWRSTAPRAKQVLDVGSGSGILAISSVLLGCDRGCGRGDRPHSGTGGRGEQRHQPHR